MPIKKRLFLIKTKGFSRGTIPYGILYIKSYLRGKGIEVDIFDRETNESDNDLLKKVVEFNPDFIGISSMTAQFKDAEYLVKTIRSVISNKVKIIAGGVHFTALPQDGIDIDADLVVRSEGEKVLSEILETFPKSNVIKGETMKNLDEIPQIMHEDLLPFVKRPETYIPKGFPIITARGCPYMCNFCLGKDQRPRGMRYHSIDYVIEYMKMVVEKFGINYFFIADDVFVVKPSRVREFCRAVKKSFSIPLNFHCFTHAGHGDSELYKEMKDAGFHTISMGVEHGNEKILELCGKKTTKEKIEKTCRDMYTAGLKTNLTYILGNIKETNSTITETVDFAIYLHRKYRSTSWFSFMQPLPGAPVYDVAELYGKYLVGEHTWQNINLCYLPFGVGIDHITRERERGMKYANPRSNNFILRFCNALSRKLFCKKV